MDHSFIELALEHEQEMAKLIVSQEYMIDEYEKTYKEIRDGIEKFIANEEPVPEEAYMQLLYINMQIDLTYDMIDTLQKSKETFRKLVRDESVRNQMLFDLTGIEF